MKGGRWALSMKGGRWGRRAEGYWYSVGRVSWPAHPAIMQPLDPGFGRGPWNDYYFT